VFEKAREERERERRLFLKQEEGGYFGRLIEFRVKKKEKTHWEGLGGGIAVLRGGWTVLTRTLGSMVLNRQRTKSTKPGGEEMEGKM